MSKVNKVSIARSKACLTSGDDRSSLRIGSNEIGFQSLGPPPEKCTPWTTLHVMNMETRKNVQGLQGDYCSVQIVLDPWR